MRLDGVRVGGRAVATPARGRPGALPARQALRRRARALQQRRALLMACPIDNPCLTTELHNTRM